MKHFLILFFVVLSCSKSNDDVNQTDPTQTDNQDNTDTNDDSDTSSDANLYLAFANASPNTIGFQYDSANNMTLRYWLNDEGQNTRTEFTYNAAGEVLKDRSVMLQFLQVVTNLAYNESSQLITGSMRFTVDSTTEYLFNFEPETGNYTRTGTAGSTDLGTIYGQPQFDSEGRLTYILFENPDATVISDFSFEYTNGNITKIVDGGGDIWEFMYDDKNSFHTFYSGSTIGADDFYGPNFDSDFMGLTHLDFTLINRIRKIPYLAAHINQNNPVMYMLNGTVYRTFDYLYNESDYPTTLITSDEEITLEYTER